MSAERRVKALRPALTSALTQDSALDLIARIIFISDSPFSTLPHQSALRTHYSALRTDYSELITSAGGNP